MDTNTIYDVAKGALILIPSILIFILICSTLLDLIAMTWVHMLPSIKILIGG